MMSDNKPLNFEDCKETMPLRDVYAFAKFGFNTKKILKENGIEPDNFMEMITCNSKNP